MVHMDHKEVCIFIPVTLLSPIPSPIPSVSCLFALCIYESVCFVMVVPLLCLFSHM